MIGSAAGSPLQQAKGSDSERMQGEAANQTRQTKGEQQAEMAAGVGHTEQHEHASDRDADGRRLWEDMSGEEQEAEEDSSAESPSDDSPSQSKDYTGQAGTRLDLQG
jgi:hypothetical protein